MSVESFWATLTVEGLKDDPVPRLFQKLPAYGRAFGYHWDDERTLMVKAAKVCFFPACRLLFRLCASLATEGGTVVRIETRKVERPYDFTSFTEFFSWFFTIWEESLDYFDRDWGEFLVPTWEYYRSRFRLSRKYYATIAENQTETTGKEKTAFWYPSIYRQIVRDFAFLQDYGYAYSRDLPHNVCPSVLFESRDKAIKVGFNYETDQMHILFYWTHGNHISYPSDLSAHVAWRGKSYKEQLEDAKRLLERFLSGDPTLEYTCMKVKEVVAFDEASGEADLLVSDGERELLCFCPLCSVKSPRDADSINAFEADGIMIADEPGFSIEKTDAGRYAYRLQGRVAATEPPAVAIGGLRVTLDQPLPKDIKQGDFVVFTALRLDCFVSLPDELYRYIKTEFPRFTDVHVDNYRLALRLHDDLLLEIDAWSNLFFNGLLYHPFDGQDVKSFLKEFLLGKDVLCVVETWNRTRFKIVPIEQFKNAPRITGAWTANEKIK